MTGKKDELDPKDLEQAQGGAGFNLEAEKTANRKPMGEAPSGASNTISDNELQSYSGGAGYEISGKKTAGRGEHGGKDPKYVIQDPWGGPDPDPEPGVKP
jgi:hypothetical protein